MWPVSCKAGIKKMHSYSSKEKTDKDDDDVQLLSLQTGPNAIFECEKAIEEFIDQVPQDYSSPSRNDIKRLSKTLKFNYRSPIY